MVLFWRDAQSSASSAAADSACSRLTHSGCIRLGSIRFGAGYHGRGRLTAPSTCGRWTRTRAPLQGAPLLRERACLRDEGGKECIVGSGLRVPEHADDETLLGCLDRFNEPIACGMADRHEPMSKFA